MAFLKPEALETLLKQRKTNGLKDTEDSREVFEQQVEELFGDQMSPSGFRR